MTRFLANVLIVSALLAAASLSCAEGAGPRRSMNRIAPRPALTTKLALGCPQTDAGWRTWRDQHISQLLEPGKGVNHLVDDEVMQRSTEFVRELTKCSELGRVPPDAIMPNFSAFVDAQSNANFLADLTHQSGHVMKDHDYLNLIEPSVTPPCLLSSTEFLDNISDPEKYRDALRLIEDQNAGKFAAKCPSDGQHWVTLVYRSHFLPTPDDAATLGRFFVLVPGAAAQKPDLWIQFGIWLPEESRTRPRDYGKPIQNVSVVAVAKPQPAGGPSQFDALADWWRVPKDGVRELELRLRRDLPPYETDNCVRCHKTVPIGIHPSAVYTFDPAGALVKVLGALKREAALLSDRAFVDSAKTLPPSDLSPEDTVALLNAYITKNYERAPLYPASPQDSIASPRNYGPAFGPERDRSPESLQACTAPHKLHPRSVDRVIDNMNCAQCHSGMRGSWGMLNYPLATEKRTGRIKGDVVPNLIRSHILNGVMPLDTITQLRVPLSRAERRALYDCLSREYFDPVKKTGVFVDWLKREKK